MVETSSNLSRVIRILQDLGQTIQTFDLVRLQLDINRLKANSSEEGLERWAGLQTGGMLQTTLLSTRNTWSILVYARTVLTQIVRRGTVLENIITIDNYAESQADMVAISESTSHIVIHPQTTIGNQNPLGLRKLRQLDLRDSVLRSSVKLSTIRRTISMILIL